MSHLLRPVPSRLPAAARPPAAAAHNAPRTSSIAKPTEECRCSVGFGTRHWCIGRNIRALGHGNPARFFGGGGGGGKRATAGSSHSVSNLLSPAAARRPVGTPGRLLPAAAAAAAALQHRTQRHQPLEGCQWKHRERQCVSPTPGLSTACRPEQHLRTTARRRHGVEAVS